MISKIKQFIKDLISDSPNVSSTRVSLIWNMVNITGLLIIYVIIALESYNWKLDITLLDKFNVLILGLLGINAGKIIKDIFGIKSDTQIQVNKDAKKTVNENQGE